VKGWHRKMNGQMKGDLIEKVEFKGAVA